MRLTQFAGIVTAVACVGAFSLLGATPAAAAEGADPLTAVAQATPDALADAAPVPTGVGRSEVINATVASTEVSVPVDPTDGIELGNGAQTVSIGLPFAAQAEDATVERPGVVSYRNNNGSSTVPIVHKDGTVQINTVIDSAHAPHRYDYPVSTPVGQWLQLGADGSAFIGDGSGNASAVVAAPWAKDATGKPVPTRYEVTGSTLTQVIDFTAGTAFPVVADPSISFGALIVVTMSQATAQSLAGGSAAAAIALFGLTGPVGAVIGAAIYGTVASYNATKLSSCRTWAFSYTYLGQLVKAQCA